MAVVDAAIGGNPWEKAGSGAKDISYSSGGLRLGSAKGDWHIFVWGESAVLICTVFLKVICSTGMIGFAPPFTRNY